MTDALSFIVPKTVLRLAMEAGVSPDVVRKTIQYWTERDYMDPPNDRGTYKYQNGDDYDDD